MTIRNNPLAGMLSSKTIALNVAAGCWEDAVRISGNLLVDAGFVEPRYVEAMIDSIKELGPYAVIVPGVALPHARPEDGVLQPCMSLITLKTPVNFGNVDNDPVKMVVSFGTVDKKAHVDALKMIARILGNKAKLDILKNAGTVDEIQEILVKADH
jgi:mannitol/fructose-specific phosphotransferase system IIA component (Ntr-type)